MIDCTTGTLQEVRERADREAITHALEVTSGNVSHAAKRLGISRPTLYDRVRSLQIPISNRG